MELNILLMLGRASALPLKPLNPAVTLGLREPVQVGILRRPAWGSACMSLSTAIQFLELA